MRSRAFTIQVLIYGLIPLVGILFFGWDWRQIIILYWLENVTVGLKTVIGIARTSNLMMGLSSATSDSHPLTPRQLRVGGILFFIAHYGMFVLVHGLFVFTLTLDASYGGDSSDPKPETVAINIPLLLAVWLVGTVVQIIRGLAQSAPNTGITQLYFDAYKRVIPLHVALLFGGFVIAGLHLPSVAAIALILLKLLVDANTFKYTPPSGDVITKT